MKTIGIYLLTVGSAEYVGSSLHIEHRLVAHRSTLRRGKHHSPRLQMAFNKYGTIVITVLEECEPERLHEREQYHIDIREDNGRLANCAPVAGTTRGMKLSDEVRRRMSESKKGISTGPRSEAARRKVSEANKGRKRTPEQRAAMSERRRADPLRFERAHKAALVNAAIHRGSQATGAKLVDDDVRRIRVLLEEGHTQKSIAAQFNVKPSNIGCIARRETWAWLDGTHILTVGDDGKARPQLAA